MIGVTFQAQTAHKWITLQSGWASTASTMIATITLGIQGTRIRDQAGIDTFTVHTLLIAGAFVVRLAANWSTAILCIS